MTRLLDAKELRSGYGRVPILAGIDISMEEGEYLGSLGHNAMGKTTLMGHLSATAGIMELSSRAITGMKPCQRSRLGLGFVPQGREIFPALSVIENLRMGMASAPREDKASTTQCWRISHGWCAFSTGAAARFRAENSSFWCSPAACAAAPA